MSPNRPPQFLNRPITDPGVSAHVPPTPTSLPLCFPPAWEASVRTGCSSGATERRAKCAESPRQLVLFSLPTRQAPETAQPRPGHGLRSRLRLTAWKEHWATDMLSVVFFVLSSHRELPTPQHRVALSGTRTLKSLENQTIPAQHPLPLFRTLCEEGKCVIKTRISFSLHKAGHVRHWGHPDF